MTTCAIERLSTIHFRLSSGVFMLVTPAPATLSAMPTAEPLHERVYRVMHERIASNTWPAGERVPAEHTLMAEFGVSRTPVRQALARLRTEGLVDGGRGAPPRVHRPVPSQPFDAFMSFTEWAHSTGRAPGQRVLDAAQRPATEAQAAALDCAPADEIAEVLRVRTLDDEPAMLERSIFPLLTGIPLLTADLNRESIYQTLRGVGLGPVRARHEIDAVGADEIDADALQVGIGAPLLRVRRRSWTDTGILIEFADDRYLPSMATFAIENSVAIPSALTRELT